MQQVRRRDGAYRWGIYRDPVDASRYVETFVVESWAEHLRQHARATVGDEALQSAAYGFHRGTAPPTVRHLVYARANGAQPPTDGAQDQAST